MFMFMFNLAIIAHENNMDQFPFEKKTKVQDLMISKKDLTCWEGPDP